MDDTAPGDLRHLSGKQVNMPPHEPAAQAEGNRSVLVAWIEVHEVDLKRALRSLANDISDERGQSCDETVRELLVEVVQIALEKAGTFDINRPAQFWLLGIARNVVRQWRDQAIKTARRTVALQEPEQENGADDLFDRLWQAATPSADAEGISSLWIKQVLEFLKPEDSEIIRLVCIEGRGAVEAGRILHIDASTARVRLSRALRRLRVALKDDETRALYGARKEWGHR